MPRRPRIARLLGLAAATALAAVPAAHGATLSGRLSSGTVPSGAGRGAEVRAVNAQTSVIAAAGGVRKGGAWTLRVPAGPYSVAASVVTRTGVTQAIAPIVRAKRTGRVRVPVVLTRKRAPRRAKETPARQAHASPGAPAVAVLDMKGSGPASYMGKGLSDMLVTDLVNGGQDCTPTVVEWEDRALLQAEIDLQNTAFVDPATRVQKRWIDPDVFVEGTVTTGAGGSGAWSIRMRDAKTGAIVGGDDGSFPAGGDWFEAERQIADKLLDQICGGSYDVTLSLRTDAVFATHIASGTVNVTLTATGTRSKPKMPPTTFTASGPISYENLSFVSKMPECSYTAFTGTPGTWTVTLEITTAGRLKVSWQTGAGGPLATATVVCDKSSVPGQPGADLILPTPVTFELPVDGGQQAIGGGLTSGTDGWTHTGTMILKRRPK